MTQTNGLEKKQRSRRIIQLLLLPAYLLAWLLSVTEYAGAQDSVGNYDIEVSLYRALDEVERATPQPSLRFATISVPPDIGSVKELLLSSHLYPDSDAFGLTYALNPDLRDALQPGEKVRIIQIPSTPDNRSAISDGFLFKIRYDDRIVRDLISSRESLGRLPGAVSALAPGSFADSGLRQPTLDCLSSISVDFGHIADYLEDRGQLTNHEMLSQTHGDVELLLRKLGRITTGEGTLTEAEESAICLVANDLKTKLHGFESARRGATTFLRWPEARVLVNTFGAITQKPVPMLRIHYVAQALQNDPGQVKQFPGLSSPAELRLPEADYVFWVTKDGDASALSDRVPVSVRRTEDAKPLIVGIVVKP